MRSHVAVFAGSHISVPDTYPIPVPMIPSPQYEISKLQALSFVPPLIPSQDHVHHDDVCVSPVRVPTVQSDPIDGKLPV